MLIIEKLQSASNLTDNEQAIGEYIFSLGREIEGVSTRVLAQFVAVVVCNVLLNPLALTLMYGMPYWVLVTSRLIKNGLCFVFECAALYVAFKTVLPLAYRTSKVRA